MQPQIPRGVFIEPRKGTTDLLDRLRAPCLLHNHEDRICGIGIRLRAKPAFKDLLRHIFHRISQHCAVLFMDLA